MLYFIIHQHEFIHAHKAFRLHLKNTHNSSINILDIG